MRWPFSKKAAAPIAQNAIMGQFGITAQLAGSSGRSMNFTGYMFDGESKESLEARIDLLQEVIERQRVRSEIPELEAKREQMLKGLEQARQVLTELEERQKNGDTLTSNERMQLRNMRTNIASVLEEAKKGEVAIQEAKKKAGVG